MKNKNFWKLKKSPDFARIVNVKRNRLTMIDDDKVIGGQSNESDCYIATILMI
jgi:hypothetical protein